MDDFGRGVERTHRFVRVNIEVHRLIESFFGHRILKPPHGAKVPDSGLPIFLLVLNGDMTWWGMASGFFAPVLIGNVIGGTALFALIAYA
jgi:formate/nitrite transporter FocA (FNT family)